MKFKKRLKAAALLGIMLALAGFMLLVPAGAQISSTRDASTAFIKEATFLTSAARTTSGDSGSPVDVAAYSAGYITINVTAVSGTSPSMTVNFEVCEDSGTTLCGFTHTASSAITATGKTVLKVNNIGRFARISYTISGTTPSFTFTTKGVFKPTT